MAQTKKKAPRPRRSPSRAARIGGDADGLVPDSGRGLIPLGQLLDNMGPSVARVIVAPNGLDVPIADPIMGLVITGLILHITYASWRTVRPRR